MIKDKFQQILNKTQIEQKTRRIAFQIYERNFEESELIFVGIEGSGYLFAKMLIDEFKKIADTPARLALLKLDKEYPVQSDVTLDLEINELENKTILVVDDVLNTGRTLVYSFKPFLNVRVRKLQTIVLVDRQHHKFPVSADYVGLTLATTLQEHIQVNLSPEEEMGAFLL